MENCDDGPTKQRLAQAGDFYTEVGRSKSSKRITMYDDALGRAWMRQKISHEEYSGLKIYALHWLAGGLQGHLRTVDLNRILSFDPGSMSGLAKTEAQADHRRLYHQAHDHLGVRPALVADHIACYDSNLTFVGALLGYRSEAHGRARVLEILADAGYRLAKFWDELNRSR